MSPVFVYIIPGAFHTPASYLKLVDALKRKTRVMPEKLEIKCIDWQRLQYLKANKVPTMHTYVERCAEIIKADLESCASTNPEIIIVSHSMGSRIAQMVVSRLSSERIDIRGMIHIAGTLVHNGCTYRQLDEQHQALISSAVWAHSVDPWHMRVLGDNSEWIEIASLQSVQQYFLNDLGLWSSDQAAMLMDTLEPEITSNVDFAIVFDQNMQRIPQFYVQTLQDRCIDIRLQREMCQDFGIEKDNVAVMDCGHEPFISKPMELSRHIVKWIQRALRTAR